MRNFGEKVSLGPLAERISGWIEDFRNAIRKLVEETDAADRDFLHFMLGMLELSGVTLSQNRNK